MPRIAAFGGTAGLIPAPGKNGSAFTEDDSPAAGTASSAATFGVGATGNALDAAASSFTISVLTGVAAESTETPGTLCGRPIISRAAARNIGTTSVPPDLRVHTAG